MPYPNSYPSTSLYNASVRREMDRRTFESPGFSEQVPSPTRRKLRDTEHSHRAHREYGAGESRHRLHHHYSRLSFHSIDENHNMHDEGLNFGAYSNDATALRDKGKIYAEFVREHFKCPICLGVLIESTTIPCGHTFCRHCLETCMRTKPKCPVCGKLVTFQIQQYSDDLAINSVAQHLDDEWQIRRQIMLESRLNSTTFSFSALATSLKIWAHRKFGEGIQLCKYLLKIVFHWILSLELGNAISRAISWINDRVSLKYSVKGIILGASLSIFYFAGADVTTFCQYLYYAVMKYDKNIPPTQQLGIVQGVEDASANKQSKFQDFSGRNDTIYAAFIRLFYEDWNWKPELL